MSKPGELHRIDMPKRQAPQSAPKRGQDAPPKAATTPLRNQHEHPSERQPRPRRKPVRAPAPRAKKDKNSGDATGSSFEQAQALMRAVAVGIPILGLVGGGAFVFGLTTLGNPETSFPLAFVVSLAALFAMLGGVTIVALVLLRQSRDIANQTETLLNRYLEPEAAASQSIATLGDAIRRQIDDMSSGVDGIVRRVTAIEQHLQGQTGELLQTMDIVERRAREAGKSLAAERDKIDDVARTLSAEVQITSQSLDEQVTAARDVMAKASGALRSAEDTLAQQISDFSEAAERGAAETRAAGDQLEQQAGRVAEITETALSAAESATQLYTDQHGMMNKAVTLLEKESGRIEQVFKNQRTMLRELAETTARQSKAIEDSISACLGGLDETLQLAAQRAEVIAGRFGEQADAILQAGEVAAGSIAQAADAAEATAAGARQAVEADAAAAAQALERQLGKLREALTGLSDETAEALERQAESSQTALDQQMSGLRQLVDARMRQARALFESMTADFTRNLDDQLKALRESRDDDQQDWEAWRDRIGTALEGVRIQARDSLQALDQTAGEVESRLAGLPERLSESAAQVRAVVSEQAGSLDGIAEQARRASGELDKILSSLPGNVDTGTKRIAQRIQEQARAIEALAATTEDRVKAVEQVIDRLPARLDAQAERIRGALDEQIKMIESLTGAAERRAKHIATLPGRTDRRSAPSAPPARLTRSEMSVQEILAEREANGEAKDDDDAQAQPSTPASDRDAPLVGKDDDKRAGVPPRTPERREKTRPPSADEPPDAQDETQADHRSVSWRQRAGEPSGTGMPKEENVAPAPSWLRRSAGDAQPGGEPAPSPPSGTDRGGPDGPASGPRTPQKVPPIFRKRFTDFEEKGGASGSGKPPPDDPVHMIRGTAARPASGKSEAEPPKKTPQPMRTGRPQAERPQSEDPKSDAPRQTRPQAEQRQPPTRPQTPRPPSQGRKQPERPSPARRNTARVQTANVTPPPPPRRTPPPTAAVAKDGPPDRPPARRADPRDAEPRPSGESGNRSGGWGWSEILAAADRASHDGDAPPPPGPVPGEGVAQEADTATGGDVGTPELQEIGREIVDSLKGLSVDLRPVWEEELPVAALKRFLAGDRRALTRKLPILGGMELLTRTRRCYRSDARFRSNVDRFVREFDMLVDQIHGLDAPRAERYMSSQNGRLFILLTQVLTKS